MTERRATVFEAIESGDLARVKRFLRRRPGAITERNEQGLSPLMWALYHNEREIAETILSRGPALDVFEAAALGDVTALRALVSRRRSRVNALSPDGFTPLHLTAFFGRREAAALLLERGADLTARASNTAVPSVQPLHSSCAARHTDVAVLLLAACADPDAATSGGWRPLHYAAVNGNLELARELLARGADPAAMADERSRPLDLAIEHGHAEIVALLTSGRPRRGRVRRPAQAGT